jgi:hypothetical protein
MSFNDDLFLIQNKPSVVTDGCLCVTTTPVALARNPRRASSYLPLYCAVDHAPAAVLLPLTLALRVCP